MRKLSISAGAGVQVILPFGMTASIRMEAINDFPPGHNTVILCDKEGLLLLMISKISGGKPKLVTMNLGKPALTTVPGAKL